MNKNNLIKYEPKYYSPLISDYVPPMSDKELDKELEWYKLNQKLKEDLKAKPKIWKQDFSEIERIKK